ncbi:MAG: M13 family metallopeptidase [Candidatus Saccharibacteria bacterium]
MKAHKFDLNIRPQDDFFGYVNNDWTTNNPIPDDESVWGTFYTLRDRSSRAIKSILQDINSKPVDLITADQKLIKQFFDTALKYDQFRDIHKKTLYDKLQEIDKITDKNHLSQYIGQLQRDGFSVFWNNFVGLDDKNSEIQVFCFYQGGITLPNRDYYLDKDEKIANIRTEYKQYFKQATNLLTKSINISWDNVWQIELALAKSSWTNVALRDVEKNYNHFSLSDLSSKFTQFDWDNYFKAQHWDNPTDNIVVSQPSFLADCLMTINNSSLEALKDYLRWSIIDNLIRWIDKKSAKVAFDFYGKVIGGKTSDKPIWKRVVDQADHLIIGEALGKEYAARFFPELSKQAVLQIVEDVRGAYHSKIETNKWMTETTKQKAHIKLDNIKALIGYPSLWQDISKLKFCDDNHLQNIISARRFSSDIEMRKIGAKPPAEDWQMNAHTVNAYYDPNQSLICFPAAILQPPFFNPQASIATNLGGIGAVVAHELTHGFDDQGSQFDELGNVRQWISDAELEQFKLLSNPIIKQADNYEALPGMFLKGKLVIGEVIADIGGIELAIEVLKSKNIHNTKTLKQLFINAAIVECGAIRDEAAIERIKTDPHPPAKFRVNCTMSHINDFYDTYNISPNDQMYLPPDKRSHIW